MAKNIYIGFPAKLVREGIPYTAKDGSPKTFNKVTLPKGVILGGKDLGGSSFSPLFVNESRLGEGYRDIPLLPDRMVRLSVPILDEGGEHVLDERGRWAMERKDVDPADLKAAMDAAREAYEQRKSDKAASEDVAEDDAADEGLYAEDVPF